MAQHDAAAVDGHGISLVKTLAEEASGATVVRIGTSGLGLGLPVDVPLLFDRKAQRASSLADLIETYRQAPARREGTAKAETLESFCALVNRHKDERSAIFGATRWPEPKLTAVIDYDDASGEARFGQHRIVYDFPLTEEFKAWVGFDGKAMEQPVFAAFIEEHAAELAAPTDGERSEFERLFRETFATPSELIELSRHLEVFVGARAKQGIRLQTGERQIEFSEEHQNAKGEKVAVPGIFMLSVPAFIDGPPVRIPARLRYRIASGDIKWFYQLYRWEAFLREEVGRALKDAGGATSLPTFEGAPEA